MTIYRSATQALLAFLLAFVWAGAAQAAVFNLTYDQIADGTIVPGDIVGTGVFSYDGPAVAGSFLLSDLTGVNFSASFTGLSGTATFTGPPFNPSAPSLIGISVTAVGGGTFEFVFTGSSSAVGGSLDIPTVTGILTHQPVALLGSDVGLNLYFAIDSAANLDVFGDYLATTASAVPAPPTLALLGLGLLSAGFARRRRDQ